MNVCFALIIGFSILPLQRGEACHAFLCNSGKCIEYAEVCDHHNDCGDFQDEHHPLCANCSIDQHSCLDGTNCFPITGRCDGKFDCGDKSDEVDCHAEGCQHFLFTCKTTGRCVEKKRTCNKINDCGDNSDEDEDVCYNGTTEKPEVTAFEIGVEKTTLTPPETTVPVYIIILVVVVCFVLIVLTIGASMSFISWKFRKMQRRQARSYLPDPKFFQTSLANQTSQNVNHYEYEYVDTKINKQDENSKDTQKKRELPDIPGSKDYEDKYIYPENFYFMIDFDKEYINAGGL